MTMAMRRRHGVYTAPWLQRAHAQSDQQPHPDSTARDDGDQTNANRLHEHSQTEGAGPSHFASFQDHQRWKKQQRKGERGGGQTEHRPVPRDDNGSVTKHDKSVDFINNQKEQITHKTGALLNEDKQSHDALAATQGQLSGPPGSSTKTDSSERNILNTGQIAIKSTSKEVVSYTANSRGRYSDACENSGIKPSTLAQESEKIKDKQSAVNDCTNERNNNSSHITVTEGSAKGCLNAYDNDQGDKNFSQCQTEKQPVINLNTGLIKTTVPRPLGEVSHLKDLINNKVYNLSTTSLNVHNIPVRKLSRERKISTLPIIDENASQSEETALAGSHAREGGSVVTAGKSRVYLSGTSSDYTKHIDAGYIACNQPNVHMIQRERIFCNNNPETNMHGDIKFERVSQQPQELLQLPNKDVHETTAHDHMNRKSSDLQGNVIPKTGSSSGSSKQFSRNDTSNNILQSQTESVTNKVECEKPGAVSHLQGQGGYFGVKLKPTAPGNRGVQTNKQSCQSALTSDGLKQDNTKPEIFQTKNTLFKPHSSDLYLREGSLKSQPCQDNTKDTKCSVDKGARMVGTNMPGTQVGYQNSENKVLSKGMEIKHPVGVHLGINPEHMIGELKDIEYRVNKNICRNKTPPISDGSEASDLHDISQDSLECAELDSFDQLQICTDCPVHGNNRILSPHLQTTLSLTELCNKSNIQSQANMGDFETENNNKMCSCRQNNLDNARPQGTMIKVIHETAHSQGRASNGGKENKCGRVNGGTIKIEVPVDTDIGSKSKPILTNGYKGERTSSDAKRDNEVRSGTQRSDNRKVSFSVDEEPPVDRYTLPVLKVTPIPVHHFHKSASTPEFKCAPRLRIPRIRVTDHLSQGESDESEDEAHLTESSAHALPITHHFSPALKRKLLTHKGHDSDLDNLKQMATRLNLSTRRPSIMLWKERLHSNPLSLLCAHAEQEAAGGGAEDEKRREAVTNTLAWLKRELTEMRAQDQVLARTLLQLGEDLRTLKLQRSCAEHQEILADAMDIEEEREILGELACEYMPDTFSPTLKHAGLTKLNIETRRFSVF